MWKVSQIMANAERETARGYEIYGYYLNLLKNSNVGNEFEKYRERLYEKFVGDI